MDLTLDDTQRALRESVATLLRRLDPPTGAYDATAEALLRESGFLELPGAAEDGGLLATMVTEDVARAFRNLAIGAHALVLPALGWSDVTGPVAVTGRDTGPARFVEAGGHAVVADGDDACLVGIDAVEPVAAQWGYTLARPVLGPVVERRPGGASALATWSRLAVLPEIVGLAEAALDIVARHLGERVQFGRPLTAQQALRHRLALLRVRIDGSRLLTYRAAWERAATEPTLEAAAYTVATGTSAVRELHQLCGSIGLTEEFELHTATTRIVTLCAELGGARTQRQALARHRWPAATAERDG